MMVSYEAGLFLRSPVEYARAQDEALLCKIYAATIQRQAAASPCEPHLVEVRDSPGKGKGLFAVADIPSGTRLTHYPGDMAGRIVNGCSSWVPVYQRDKPAFAVAIPTAPEYTHNVYLGGKRFHIAPLQPRNYANPRLLAHVANDSAGPECFARIPRVGDTTRIQKAIVEYAIRAGPGTNALLQQDKRTGLVTLVTHRTIKRDKEVFVAYGSSYWLGCTDLCVDEGALARMPQKFLQIMLDVSQKYGLDLERL